MASTIQIISAPLSYLKIKQPQKKWFDYVLPLILSVSISVAIIIFDLTFKDIELFSEKGIVNIINGLTQILPGFYLTSMAAVATFPNKYMDNIMYGIPPKINGNDLTRREFLISLFGYLCFVCIILYLYGSLSIYFYDFFSFNIIYSKLMKFLFCLIYFYILFNMLLTTSLGLYFLIFKINKDLPKLEIESLTIKNKRK